MHGLQEAVPSSFGHLHAVQAEKEEEVKAPQLFVKPEQTEDGTWNCKITVLRDGETLGPDTTNFMMDLGAETEEALKTQLVPLLSAFNVAATSAKTESQYDVALEDLKTGGN